MSEATLSAATAESAAALPAAAAVDAPLAAGQVCVTCGAAGVRAYCADCGQPAHHGRLTLRGVFTRLVTDAFDLDRGIVFTALALFRRPGGAIRDYVSGRTVRYTNPVKYFLLMGALAAVAYLTLGFERAMEAFLGTAQGAADDPFTGFVNRHFTLVMAATLPFMTAASRLLFRRAGYNVAEHAVFNVYVFAQQCLLSAAGTAVAWALNVPWLAFYAAYLAVSLAYYAWAAADFFHVRALPAALRTVGVWVLGYSAFILLGMLAGIVFVLVSLLLSV